MYSNPSAVFTSGATTCLSRIRAVLSGSTLRQCSGQAPEPSWGACPEPVEESDRLAEMSGQALVITEPLAVVRSVMSGGSSSYCRVKRAAQAAWLPASSSVWTRR